MEVLGVPSRLVVLRECFRLVLVATLLNGLVSPVGLVLFLFGVYLQNVRAAPTFATLTLIAGLPRWSSQPSKPRRSA